MAIKEFRLPDLGEGLTESEVVAWRVAVGDAVTLNQVIADVETAKAVVELPSPFTGTVARLHADAGVTIEVGAPLVSFQVDDGTPSAGEDQDPADGGGDAEDEVSPPNLVGYGAQSESRTPVRRARVGLTRSSGLVDEEAPSVVQAEPAAAPPAAPAAPAAAPPPAPAALAHERPRSTPPVRKLAQQLGVPLDSVPGSGERGLVTRDDVERAAQSSRDAPSPHDPRAGVSADGRATSPGSRETRGPDDGSGHHIPLTGVRRLTADAMVASAFTAPHVTVFLTVDVTRTVDLLAELKGTAEFRDVRLNVLVAVARAVCLALGRHEEVNARWNAADGDLLRFDAVHLGIAAATPRGLLVPVIRDADALGLADLAGALSELVTVAKAGTTRPEALRGGTFTLSNVGVFGVDAGTPILHDGQAAILAVGAVAKRPWAHRGELALRDVVTLSLSIDHRVLDGEQGARFLAEVGALLSDPARAFTLPAVPSRSAGAPSRSAGEAPAPTPLSAR